MNRLLLITLAGIVLFGFSSLPAYAQYGQQATENFSFGGGYWSMPGVDTQGGTIDDSGFYASVSMISSNYFLEFDYSFEDPEFYVLAADYIYPLDQSAGMFGGSTFLGVGYTYFSSDVLDNESGFNVVGGANLGDSLMGTIRYDYLGSDQELLTFGVTYMF